MENNNLTTGGMNHIFVSRSFIMKRGGKHDIDVGNNVFMIGCKNTISWTKHTTKSLMNQMGLKIPQLSGMLSLQNNDARFVLCFTNVICFRIYLFPLSIDINLTRQLRRGSTTLKQINILGERLTPSKKTSSHNHLCYQADAFRRSITEMPLSHFGLERGVFVFFLASCA